MKNLVRKIRERNEMGYKENLQDNRGLPTFKKDDLVRLLVDYDHNLKYDGEKREIIGEVEGIIEQLVDNTTTYCDKPLNGKAIMSVLREFASKNTINPRLDYINSVEWDGVSRIYQALPFKYEDSEYNRLINRNFFVNLVARVLNPGCNVQQWLVLKGNQGTGKSRFCELIGGEFFTSKSRLNEWSEQDDCMSIRGKILVEFGEMQTNKNSVEKIKQWLSKSEDEYREPYASNRIKVQRTCNFIFTSNKNDLLNDPTGSRRYMILDIKNQDNEICEDKFQYLISNLAQIFAEAIFIYRGNNEKVFETYLPDYYKDIFKSKLEYQEEIELIIESMSEVSSTEIQNQLWSKNYLKLTLNKISTILEHLGYKKIRVGNKRVWVK